MEEKNYFAARTISFELYPEELQYLQKLFEAIAENPHYLQEHPDFTVDDRKRIQNVAWQCGKIVSEERREFYGFSK